MVLVLFLTILSVSIKPHALLSDTCRKDSGRHIDVDLIPQDMPLITEAMHEPIETYFFQFAVS